MPVYGKPRTEGVDLRRRAAFAAGGRRPTDGFSQQRREAFAAQGPQPLANIGQPSQLPKPVLPPGATMATANPPGAAYGQYQPSMQSPGQSFGPSTMPGMPAMPKPMSPPPVGGPMPPNWGPMQGPNAYQGYADPNRSMADPAMREQQVRLQQAMNKQNAFQAGLPDRMAQFDMRQAQQNATGRANAFRKTQFGGDAPMSGGHYAAPFVQPGVQMGQSQPGQIGAGMPQGLPQPDGTRLGDSYAAAMGGQLRPGAMPQGVPMMPPGVPREAANDVAMREAMYGQSQRDGGVTRGENGLASGRNFVPADADPSGTGTLGTIGGSQLVRRPGQGQPGVAGNQLSLMGPDAADAYQSRLGQGMGESAARRSTMRQFQNTDDYKAQVQAQADRLRPGIQANNQRKDDLRALARSRKAGVAPDKDLLARVGGGKGAVVAGSPKLTLKDRADILDPTPEKQKAQAGVLGYEPANSNPQDVFDATVANLEMLDPSDAEGRQAILQGAMAARGRRNFSGGKMHAKVTAELDSLLKDPDGYLKRRKNQAPAGAASVPPQSPAGPPTTFNQFPIGRAP
jgi:hypothetical protein